MGTRNPIPTTCPKCFKEKDGFEFVLLHWLTTSGKQRKEMVCTTCYDRVVSAEKIASSVKF